MEMTVLDGNDNITRVVLAGRLDATGVETIGDRLTEATADRDQPAIIDLSAIEFLASRGIGVLITAGKRLMKAGHKVVLLRPEGMVEAVLKTCRIDKMMPITHDPDEAIRLAGGAPAAASASPAETAEERPSPLEAAATDVNAGRLDVTIKNEMVELDRLNEAVGRFLDFHGVPRRASYAVNLAIDELVVNVIRYAYIDDDPHEIEIELAIEGEQIVLRIVDDGRPFDPRRGPELELDSQLENREPGGLGLYLVVDMVDALKYRREEDQNRAEVRVRLLPDASGEASHPPDEPSSKHDTAES